MTVMQRLVEKSASYVAQNLAREFAGGILPKGEDREWKRDETDWHFFGSKVHYPAKDADLVSGFLAPATGALIADLKKALEQTPDSKLTFYGILPESLFKYRRMFRDTDYRAQVICGDVIVLACGNYFDKVRRIWVNVQCTPLLKREANCPVPMDNGDFE